MGEDEVEEIGSVKRWRRWGKCLHTRLTCTRRKSERDPQGATW